MRDAVPDHPSPQTPDEIPTVTVSAPGDDDVAATAPSASVRDDDEIVPGTALGRYVVVELIGTGGMGSVWRAFDPQLQRHVAIKRVRVRGRANPTRARDRLMREAQALAQLSHPNVVAVHDVVLVGDDLFVAMELIAGETLRAWLAEPRDPRAIVAVFLDAGHGLAAAHRAGLVHRDVKPDNVIVGADGRARVVDFGVARVARDADSLGPDSGPSSESGDESSPLSAHLTAAGAVVGTPRYMAPEQHRGAAIDARTDQFAFCVALYEALFKTRPFPAANGAELRERVLAGDVAPPPASSRVPAAWRRAVLRGLSVDPARRFPTMDALLEVLRRDPRTARRRAAVGIAVAALAVTAAVVALRRPAGGPDCARAGDRVAEVWSPAARARLHAAFVGSALPYATDVAGRLTPRWDRFAGDWRSARVEACRATHDRGEQSTALLDRRMACLDRKLEQMTQLLGALTDAPARDAIDRAVQATTDLADLEACSARVQLGAPAAADPAARASVDAVLAEVDRVAVLTGTGAYQDALALARQAVDHARAAGDPRALALALRARGGAEDVTGAYAESDRSYVDALHAAAAAADRALIAEIWMSRTAVANERQQKLERAAVLIEAAAVAVSLAEDPPGGELHRNLALRRGLVHLGAGALDDALRDIERAVELCERRFGADDYRVASVLSQLGHVLMKRGEYARAEQVLGRSVEVYERSLGPTHPRLTTPLVNLGGVLSYQRKRTDAAAIYRRALAIDEAALGPDHPYVADDLTNLAGVLLAEEKYDEAEGLLDRALVVQERQLGPESPAVAWTLTGLAEVRTGQRRFDDARTLLRRALAITVETQGAQSEAAAQIHGHVAVTYLREGKLAIARRELERTLAMFERHLGPDHPRLAVTLSDLAECEAERGDHAAARRAADRALALVSRDEVAIDASARAWLRFLRARAAHALGDDPAQRVAEARAAAADLDPAADRARRAVVDAWLRAAGR